MYIGGTYPNLVATVVVGKMGKTTIVWEDFHFGYSSINVHN